MNATRITAEDLPTRLYMHYQSERIEATCDNASDSPNNRTYTVKRTRDGKKIWWRFVDGKWNGTTVS